MEEFNLEKYNTGNYDVVTRDGKKARIICTDRKEECYTLICLMSDKYDNEEIISLTKDGKYNSDWSGHPYDILLKKKKWKPEEGQRYWYVDSANMTVRNSIFYLSTKHNNRIRINNFFKTEEEAKIMSEKFKQLLRDE